MLTKQEILGRKLATERVSAWGGEVLIRELSGLEREKFQLSIWRDKESSQTNIRARLVALGVIGDDGQRIFADDDIEALGATGGADLERVYDAIHRISKLGREDIEEAEKNLSPDRNGVSSSS